MPLRGPRSPSVVPGVLSFHSLSNHSEPNIDCSSWLVEGQSSASSEENLTPTRSLRFLGNLPLHRLESF